MGGNSLVNKSLEMCGSDREWVVCYSLTGMGLLCIMSESAARFKLFFRSTVALHCCYGYTTSGRSGG